MVETESDAELLEMAHAEVERLNAEQEQRMAAIHRLLLPKDPNDDKNVIVEIRAGAGGDEAGLFAADLLRMYPRWADEHGFKTDLLSHSETGSAALKKSSSRCAAAGPIRG